MRGEEGGDNLERTGFIQAQQGFKLVEFGGSSSP